MQLPRIGVVAVQGDVREHVRSLGRCGATPVTVRRATDVAGLDGLLVPGGESTTIGKLLVDSGAMDAVRAFVAAGHPVMGTCAGLALLANTVEGGKPEQPLIGGLEIVVRRNGFGRQVASFETPVQVEGIAGGDFPGVFIRAPYIREVGSAVDTVATIESEDGTVAVAVRQGPILATSFHPELTEDDRFHAWFVDLVRENMARSSARSERGSAEGDRETT